MSKKVIDFSINVEKELEDQTSRLKEIGFSEYEAKQLWLDIRDYVASEARDRGKQWSEDAVDGFTNLMVYQAIRIEEERGNNDEVNSEELEELSDIQTD